MKQQIKLDECRLSILFNTPNPINEENLEFKLINRNYKINKERVITRPPLQAVILNYARKNAIDIVYENEKRPTFIGVVGKKPDDIMVEFELLKNDLENIDFAALELNIGYEAIIWSRPYRSGQNAKDILKKFAKNDIKKFSKKFSKNFVMDNFTIKYMDDNNSFISFHIAPYYVEPRSFYMQLAIRSLNLEDTFEFLEKYDKYISDLLDLLDNNE